MASKTDKKHSQSEPSDDRLAYLHRIGLTDKTAADLQAPDLAKFATRAGDDFEIVGNDVHGGFEYYRAVDDLSVRKAEGRGYFRLPGGTDVKFKGCHTESEIMMARTKETGDAYRQAEHERRAALRSGNTGRSTPMGGGAVLNESTSYKTDQVRIRER